MKLIPNGLLCKLHDSRILLPETKQIVNNIKHDKTLAKCLNQVS